jgi:hypothetical protein
MSGGEISGNSVTATSPAYAAYGSGVYVVNTGTHKGIFTKTGGTIDGTIEGPISE